MKVLVTGATGFVGRHLVAALLAVDPAGLGGVALRASAGPLRDAWLALLIAQHMTINRRANALHRQMGRASFVLFPFLILGFMMIINVSAARYSAPDAGEFIGMLGPSFGIGMGIAIAAYLTLFYLAMKHRHKVRLHADNVRLVQSDLFKNLDGEVYDLIVTNPPYVTHAETDALPPEYSHEPELGLRAGDDGLDLALEILRDAPRHLSENGLLICEVGESERALVELLPELPLAWVEFKVGQMGIFAVEAAELRAHHARIAINLQAAKAQAAGCRLGGFWMRLKSPPMAKTRSLFLPSSITRYAPRGRRLNNSNRSELFSTAMPSSGKSSASKSLSPYLKPKP